MWIWSWIWNSDQGVRDEHYVQQDSQSGSTRTVPRKWGFFWNLSKRFWGHTAIAIQISYQDSVRTPSSQRRSYSYVCCTRMPIRWCNPTGQSVSHKEVNMRTSQLVRDQVLRWLVHWGVDEAGMKSESKTELSSSQSTETRGV